MKRLPILLLLLLSVSMTRADAPRWHADPALVNSLSERRPGVNYDEAQVPAYELPDPLRCGDGTYITSIELWPRRRGEILELFRASVYGRRPGKPERLSFETLEEDSTAMDGAATLLRIAIHSQQASRTHRFELVLFLPNHAGRPVPVFLLINNRAEGNTDPTRKERTGFWPAEQIIARGYGAASFHYAELAPDDPGHFREGAINLFEGGPTSRPAATRPSATRPAETKASTAPSSTAAAASSPSQTDEHRPADAWGALAAWGWGASRAMDYFETNPRIDPRRVALVGHSRGGKAALWAGAEDTRFAMIVSNGSGCGGAAISRRRFGETLRIINDHFPHWFCGNFKSFNDREAELPLDQHMLIALIAPRAVYVASGSEDLWADPRGEFLSLARASSVYGLWGAPAIGDDAMPGVDAPLVSGPRGYHIHRGPHNLTPGDWDRFMDFADRLWPRPAE